MKKYLIITLIITITSTLFTSCSQSSKSDYSFEEMQTLVTMGQAQKTKDSITIIVDFKYEKYPIIKIKHTGYYPAVSKIGLVRYYAAKQ